MYKLWKRPTQIRVLRPEQLKLSATRYANNGVTANREMSKCVKFSCSLWYRCYYFITSVVGTQIARPMTMGIINSYSPYTQVTLPRPVACVSGMMFTST